jgi:hypothetical protein
VPECPHPRGVGPHQRRHRAPAPSPRTRAGDLGAGAGPGPAGGGVRHRPARVPAAKLQRQRSGQRPAVFDQGSARGLPEGRRDVRLVGPRHAPPAQAPPPAPACCRSRPRRSVFPPTG